MNYLKTVSLLGLTIHVVYVIIILSTSNDVSKCWQVDNGQLTEIIRVYRPDSKSYIESADNYMEYGIFGHKDKLDYRRTIGYPFIIYCFKVAFGQYWYYGLVIFQILLSVLIYPIVYSIGITIFPDNRKTIFYSVIALMLSGAYYVRTLNVLTDLTFTVFFLLGIYLSIISLIRRRGYIFILLGVISLSFSGLVRPVLIIYPLVHVILLLYVARRYNTWRHIRVKQMIIISTIFLAVTCNFSSFRLYNFYGTFSPTDVLGINMFEYSVEEILKLEGEKEKFLILKQMINNEDDWLVRDEMRKEYFFEVVSRYPVSAMQYWFPITMQHLVTPHLMEVGHSYGYYKRDLTDERTKHSVKRSIVMVGIFWIFSVVNIAITFFCFWHLLYRLFKYKDYLFFLSFLSLIFFIVGPSCIARTSTRMRIPVEPFIIILSFKYLEYKKDVILNVIKLIRRKLSWQLKRKLRLK